MNPVPTSLIAYARVPKRDRRSDYPQYRLYVSGTPGGFGAGYTDILVVKITQGWYLVDRKRGGSLVSDWNVQGLGTTHFHTTRAAAAAEMHLAPDFIPENVREYLEAVAP